MEQGNENGHTTMLWWINQAVGADCVSCPYYSSSSHDGEIARMILSGIIEVSIGIRFCCFCQQRRQLTKKEKCLLSTCLEYPQCHGNGAFSLSKISSSETLQVHLYNRNETMDILTRQKYNNERWALDGIRIKIKLN